MDASASKSVPLWVVTMRTGDYFLHSLSVGLFIVTQLSPQAYQFFPAPELTPYFFHVTQGGNISFKICLFYL